ncbi:MAG: bifunctional 4-hydroxy-2-oxoglutarate aldolase/2-dehydro-3-deoxy-phosphogluconate aldolase [Betaproteobacteria bacterium]|nr:bifunctional 4-hydroxy-2-oxoglutarate aldolase/2-dehydro-3-deoxy-phosphogluconate aldolase [Betaproteobacteria bacterium]
MYSPVMTRIHELKLVPVIVLEDASNATPLAEALVAGGLPCAEVTFRAAAAVQSIRSIARFDDICLGAGTVLTVDQVKAAVDAGAKYIVTPGFNPEVVGYCLTNGIPVTPGVATPTDIELGLKFGLEVLKFFPAEAFGGVKTLRAISAPYSMIKFIPTGGISEGNVREYLAFDKVFACGGSWMVRKDLIDAGKFDEIASLTRKAVNLVADL